MIEFTNESQTNMSAVLKVTDPDARNKTGPLAASVPAGEQSRPGSDSRRASVLPARPASLHFSITTYKALFVFARAGGKDGRREERGGGRKVEASGRFCKQRRERGEKNGTTVVVVVVGRSAYNNRKLSGST